MTQFRVAAGQFLTFGGGQAVKPPTIDISLRQPPTDGGLSQVQITHTDDNVGVGVMLSHIRRLVVEAGAASSAPPYARRNGRSERFHSHRWQYMTHRWHKLERA